MLGLLTRQLLKANGCDIFSNDLSESLINLANEISVNNAVNRNDSNLIGACDNFTSGKGFNNVITAAAPTNDPIVLGTEICRKKRKNIYSGRCKDGHIKQASFYKKELELKISSCYRHGRYGLNYERLGAIIHLPMFDGDKETWKHFLTWYPKVWWM